MQQNLWLAAIYTRSPVPLAIAGYADRGAGDVRLLSAGYSECTARVDEEGRHERARLSRPDDLALGLTGQNASFTTHVSGSFAAKDFVRTGLVLTVIALALVMLLGATYWRWLGYI
jgi:hypothetical protein